MERSLYIPDGNSYAPYDRKGIKNSPTRYSKFNPPCIKFYKDPKHLKKKKITAST